MLGVDSVEQDRVMSDVLHAPTRGLHHASQLYMQHPHYNPGSYPNNTSAMPTAYHYDYSHSPVTSSLSSPDNSNLQTSTANTKEPQAHPPYSQSQDELPPPPPITPPPTKERFSYTRYQLQLLNGIYIAVRYPNSIQKQLIAKRVGITRDQVKIWFQNRRRKDVVGPKAGNKPKSPPGGDESGGCMVPDRIMKGVLDELERYSEDLKKNNKRAKGKASTQPPNERPKPYDVTRKNVPTGHGTTGRQVQPNCSFSSNLDNLPKQLFHETDGNISVEASRTVSPPTNNASPISNGSSSSDISLGSSPQNACVPSSEQLDMVAPPNAIAPGAQLSAFPPDGVPPMSESPCIDLPPSSGPHDNYTRKGSPQVPSPSSSGEMSSQHQQTSPLSDRLQEPLQAGGVLPTNTHINLPDSQPQNPLGPFCAAPGNIREYNVNSHPGIFAPIPSYMPTPAHTGWHMGDTHRPVTSHMPLDRYDTSTQSNQPCAPTSHVPSMTDYPGYSREHGLGPGPSGQSLHSAAYADMKQQHQHQQHQQQYQQQTGFPPSFPHPPMMHGDLGDMSHSHPRVFPFPIVAEPPRRLSTMPGAYSDPYSSAYKSPAVPASMHPALYRDAYQPLLISSFNNPYYGMDGASWQSMDRKTFTSL